MYILIGLLLIILGLAMVISPKTFYIITQSWKNDSSGEPSGLFLFSARFGGVMFFLAGAASITVTFMK